MSLSPSPTVSQQPLPQPTAQDHHFEVSEFFMDPLQLMLKTMTVPLVPLDLPSLSLPPVPTFPDESSCSDCQQPRQRKPDYYGLETEHGRATPPPTNLVNLF